VSPATLRKIAAALSNHAIIAGIDRLLDDVV
jgi:hypothetical protein